VLFPQSFQEQLSVKAFRPTTDTTEGANAASSMGLELQASQYPILQTQQQHFQTLIHPQAAYEDPQGHLKMESTRHQLSSSLSHFLNQHRIAQGCP
jgi:hypothetical protein